MKNDIYVDIYEAYLEEIEYINQHFCQQSSDARSTENAKAFLYLLEQRNIDIQKAIEKKDLAMKMALGIEEGEK